MITTTDTLDALTAAFNAAQIDTPQKVQAFVTVAALQVKMNTLDVELQKLAQTQAAALADQQAARELKIAEKNAAQATLLALVAAQS